VAKGRGECPIFKFKRTKKNGEEYYTQAFDLVLPDGTKKRFTQYADETKGDFVKRRQKVMQEHEKVVCIGVSFILVKDFLKDWLSTKRDISSNSKTTYQNYLDAYILPILGEARLQKVEQAHIERLISELAASGGNKKKGLSPATLRKVKFMLKQAFEHAIERELIIRNPTNKVKLPKVIKPTIKPLTKDDISKVLKSADGTPMYIAILLDISTGLRRGELLALRWQDIDLETGIANIYRQLIPIAGGVEILDNLKTEKSTRQIGIPDKVVMQLKVWKAQQEAHRLSFDTTDTKYFDKDIDNDLIVRQTNGKHYHPRNFAKNFNSILKAAGLEVRKIHDMRHTFATQLLTAGFYINEVQQGLGHADAKTTLQNYGHILPGRQKELANKMNDILPI